MTMHSVRQYGFQVNGLLVSENSKTGLSINVNQCSPTRLCQSYCYARFRTKVQIRERGWETTPNISYTALPRSRRRYVLNEAALKALSASGQLYETAAEITTRAHHLGITYLRGNGVGDMFEELVELYSYLAASGLNVYAFSRRSSEIEYLSQLCTAMDIGLGHRHRPFVIGSVDSSTTDEDVEHLIAATAAMNGKPALAYACLHGGTVGCKEIDTLPFAKHIHVVFGYHASNVKAILGHARECPCSAGSSITCFDCKRCFGLSYRGN